MSRSLLAAALGCSLALGAAEGLAQRALEPGEGMPAGHPPLNAPVAPPSPAPSGSAKAATTARAPAASASAPSDAPTATPAATADPSSEEAQDEDGDPHSAAAPGQAAPRENKAAAAPDLRPGDVEVVVRDATEAPQADVLVVLGSVKKDVATGDEKSEQTARTDASGVARFQGLPNGTSYQYRASVGRDTAMYLSPQFALDERTGQRVLLHVYPATSDLRRTLVGVRAAVFVGPREDVFQVEANFQVFNIGAIAWVPENVRIELPPGAKAFRAQEAAADARIEKTDSGALVLRGTFAPGQNDLSFSYQLDNEHVRSRSLRMGLPPHVAEMRVIAEAPRGTTLDVTGFPEPEPTRGQDGSRLLVTARRMGQGDGQLDRLELTLDGLPVPSQGRWYAVVFAAAIAALGLGSVLVRRPERDGETPEVDDAETAERLLLDELVALERLRREDRIGPKTYQASRTELVDALARIEAKKALIVA